MLPWPFALTGIAFEDTSTPAASMHAGLYAPTAAKGEPSSVEAANLESIQMCNNPEIAGVDISGLAQTRASNPTEVFGPLYESKQPLLQSPTKVSWD